MHHGLISPVRRRCGMPYSSSSFAPHTFLGIEQPERMLEHRRKLIARLQHIDRLIFHQRLQALRQRRLTAADGPSR
jgi:hypothetical protein